ncbi:hypothetical protein [Streptomyces tendae]|uniref:hypothetical protein n=1 Tax=Streptomyces tendae TaxID=1932 RepID=UPI00248FC898|nr:hypothetical protein [Streptomyces tendae]
MIRRVAGWCVLALIPLTLVFLAGLAGQLAELAVGTAIAVFLMLLAIIGNHLLTEADRRRN